MSMLRFAAVAAAALLFATSPAHAQKPIEINVLSVGGQARAVLELREDFEKMYQKEFGAPVKVNVIRAGYGELHEKLVSESMASSSSFDVVMLTHAWIPEFAERGLLEDLTAYTKNPKLRAKDLDLGDFIPSVLDSYGRWGPKLVAFPYIADVMLLYYRADLFDEYKLKPPNTWDEYLEVAKKLTIDRDGDGKIDIYGNSLMAGLSHHNTILWMQRHLSMMGKREIEGTLWDKNRKPIFNNAQGQAALKAYKDILAYSPPGAITYQYADAITAFQKGIAAMTEQWTMAYGPFNDPKRSSVAGKVKVALIPGTMQNGQVFRVPHLGGWSMGVNSKSKQKDPAYKFVEYICFTMDVEKAHKSATPSRTSSYQKLDPEKDASLKAVFGHLPLIGQSLPIAQTRPRTIYTQELVDTMNTNVHETLVGKKSPEAALAGAEKEWARLLRK